VRPNEIGRDPVVVGLVANRLHSLLNEQQTALVNTAFSPVVRESLDLACGVFDSHGQMIGQSTGGTPGHINAMATGMQHIVSSYPPERLSEGDVLITNDPWMTAGQINDLTVATPVFRDGEVVAWFANCCHSPDIGGRILSAAATEVFEEGLRLPILKLLHGGRTDEVVERIIRANVRTPDETMGDIYAQVAGNQVGARSLLTVMDEFGLPAMDGVAADIMLRSEHALRAALRQLPDGVYRAAMSADGFGDQTLEVKVAVTIEGDGVTVDYAGSSEQSTYGVNVVLNYTRAYTSFAIKAALAPEVPHNAGSFRPVDVVAPRGSVLNCVDPAPVASRHLVGHFLPSLLFEALRPAVGGGLPAASADALWMTVWRGAGASEAQPFTLTVFGAGGSGGRPQQDGLTTTGFPTGVRAAPTEVLETLTPLVQRRREIRADSGGGGLHRGGLGQVVEVRRRGESAWTVNANVDRVLFPAPGAVGGLPGARGAFVDMASGEDLPRKQLVRLRHDTQVRLSFPGGGGYGEPHDRPIDKVLDDVVNDYVSIDAARDIYGVDVTYVGPSAAMVRRPDSYRVDHDHTAVLRAHEVDPGQQTEQDCRHGQDSSRPLPRQLNCSGLPDVIL
jgi:N-methylhydantoinase B